MTRVYDCVCSRCYRPTTVGEHGVGLCPYEPRRDSALVKDDTIDLLAENAWREPRYFSSQRTYEKALDASGLMLKPRKLRGAEPVTADTLRWAAERLRARAKTDEINVRELETFTVRLEETVDGSA